jgi:hypothetical protein
LMFEDIICSVVCDLPLVRVSGVISLG